jgi:three-Cys-motif partner protein
MLKGHEFYEGREQTWVKHFVLRKYLERFAHIIGSWRPSITYVDGFSGPWRHQSESLSDTSFSIAISELRKARDTFARRGKDVRIRCIFLEQDRTRFAELKAYSDAVSDADVLTLNSKFEDAIPQIIHFVEKERGTFPFIFIDPTGWTGFSMKSIAPLLKRRHSEVLINFMLDFIRRFIEQEFTREGFRDLFGSDEFDIGLKNLQGLDRDNAIAERYCRSLQVICGFKYVQRAIVIHPDKDQSDFELVYGTRHPKGVEVFKEVEQQAMDVQETSRAYVESKTKRRREGGQTSFLEPTEMPESQYYAKLRDRYSNEARMLVVNELNVAKDISYDDLWALALSRPLVWKRDLDKWLKEWCDNGVIEWKGRTARERTFKRDKGHHFSCIVESIR